MTGYTSGAGHDRPLPGGAACYARHLRKTAHGGNNSASAKDRSSSRSGPATIEALTRQKQDIERVYQELQVQEQRRSEFLTVLAHELRTPLTSANGFMQLIKSGGRITVQSEIDRGSTFYPSFAGY